MVHRRFGTIETSIGIGSLIGPIFAGLADLADYYLPFLVVGALMLIPAFMATMVMPSGTFDSKESISMFSLLKVPGVIILSLGKILGSATPLMIDPTLAPHLEPFGLSLAMVGCTFIILSLSFTISSPIVGKLVRLVKYKLPFMIFGSYGLSISYLLLGPSPLIGLEEYQQLWPTLISLGLVGFCWAFITVPPYERFVAYATWGCPEVNTEVLMTSVACINFMIVSGAEFIAPVLAGALFDSFGFSWTMTIAALMCLFTGTMLLVTFVSFGNGPVSFRKSAVENDGKSEEKEALLNTKNDSTILKDKYTSVLAAYRHPREFIYRIMNRNNITS